MLSKSHGLIPLPRRLETSTLKELFLYLLDSTGGFHIASLSTLLNFEKLESL
jgi:hypothetical protein